MKLRAEDLSVDFLSSDFEEVGTGFEHMRPVSWFLRDNGKAVYFIGPAFFPCDWL